MADSTTDIGIIQVVIDRLEKQRLPRLLDIKSKVDGGAVLEDFDLEFLEQSMADAKAFIPIIDKHPEYQSLASKMMRLYKYIVDKDLQIEKSAG